MFRGVVNIRVFKKLLHKYITKIRRKKTIEVLPFFIYFRCKFFYFIDIFIQGGN